jgi:uncharacterized protein (TIGR02996 family)
VDDEAGFLAALAIAPDDLIAHLVYADWLEERGDPGAACLRLWVELLGSRYEESSYRSLLELMERFRVSLRAAEPEWVELVGEAREWVGSGLAELATRLHLRVREGRKEDRQWIDRVYRSALHPVWHVSYWLNPPERRKATLWREPRNCLMVDRVTGEIKMPT